VARIPVHLLQRTFASHALDIVKMSNLVPCEVENPLNNFHCRIVEIVFDPLHIPDVNKRFRADGYKVPQTMQVIAINGDGSILLWGGANSIFHLRKGDVITGPADEKHIAFEDILGLTKRFNIRNTKSEIDDLIFRLRACDKLGNEAPESRK
jgi:hypothetical protein